MKKIVRLISAVICFFQLNVQAEEPKEYTFAINSAVTPLLHAAFINETIKTVERSVAPAKLKVLYVELPELERLIENHQTDFFISTAATIRRYQDLGARDVLTASSPFSKNPNRSEGSLFIVKAGRSDINSISDLKDKRAAAGRPTAFGMYLAAMGEIAADGYDPKTFFKSTQFYGLNRDQIIKDVLDGKADVGILRACYLEDAVNRKVVTTDQLKFINLKKRSGAYLSAFHASLSELELRIESFRSAGSLVGRGSRPDCTKTCWHRPVLVCGERLHRDRQSPEVLTARIVSAVQ